MRFEKSMTPKYQEILVNIVLDMLIEPGEYHPDIDMIYDRFSKECPGPYEMRYQKSGCDDTTLSGMLDNIKLEFPSTADKIEWMLKWG